MTINLNAKNAPSEAATDQFDTSEVMRLGKLWSQARSVHPDDTTRQNAAFLDALAVFENSVRNSALEEAASALEGLPFVQDGVAHRKTNHAGSWQEQSTVGLFVTTNTKKIRSLKS